jgi:hypothetical protein
VLWRTARGELELAYKDKVLAVASAQMADHLRYEFCVRTKPVAGRDDVYRFRAISSKELKLWKAALPFNDAVAVIVPS